MTKILFSGESSQSGGMDMKYVIIISIVAVIFFALIAFLNKRPAPATPTLM